MGNISPSWRGERNEVMAEVDEGIDVLPLVEIVVIQITACTVDSSTQPATHEVIRTHFRTCVPVCTCP